jgi:hypothetical protein
MESNKPALVHQAERHATSGALLHGINPQHLVKPGLAVLFIESVDDAHRSQRNVFAPINPAG